MYGIFSQEQKELTEGFQALSDNFLTWHRTREFDATTETILFRGGRHQQRQKLTLVVACRYWYELTDGFWGQLAITQLPHVSAADILPHSVQHLLSMRNFAGMLEYLGQADINGSLFVYEMEQHRSKWIVKWILSFNY